MASGEAVGKTFQGLTYAGVTLATRGRGQAKAVTLSQSALWFGRGLGQFTYGASMEGMGHMVEAIDVLTNYRELPPEALRRLLENKRKQFSTLTKDPAHLDDMIKKYKQDNFEVRDGKIWWKPLTYEEAIHASWASSIHQALVGGAIETLDVLGAKFFNARKGGIKSNIFWKNIDWVDNFIRDMSVKYPNITAGKRLIFNNKFSKHIANGFGNQVYQGMEEVMQGYHNSAVKAWGAGYNDLWKKLMHNHEKEPMLMVWDFSLL